MPFHVNDGGVWKEPEVWVNDGGTWKRAAVWVNDGGTWKQAAATTVSVTISPASRSNSSPNTSFTFASTTVTVSGATATSFTWGFLNASGGTWAINSGQGTASARARINNTVSGGSATFYCDVVVNGQTYRVTCPHTFSRIT